VTDLRDRDDVIDRWMRRARSVQAGAGPNDACLDAEVMAAWTDGGLSADALKLVRAHVAGCARCQVLAAVMAKLDSAGEAEVAESRRPARRPWLTWFAPLAAAAAAVTIYVFIPRQPPGTDDPAAPAQMAKARAAAESNVPSANAAPVAPAPAQEPARDDFRQNAPKLTAKAQDPQVAKREADRKDLADRQAAVGTREEIQRERAQQTVTEPKKADAKPAASVPPPIPPPPPATVPTGVATALPPPPAAPPPATQSNALGQAGATRVAGAGRGGGGGAAARPAEAFRETDALSDVVTREIASSDPNVRWRIRGTLIHKTTDGGQTWLPVAPVMTLKSELTAGAAPSPTTCWLVGKAGTVLLTTDGQKWEQLKFPAPTDLSAVRATDARTATVTTVDGREYSTIDGGNTWVRK
jgi:hypothetical protein